MSDQSKIWFRRWSWMPVNRAGWLFYLVSFPALITLFLVSAPIVLGDPGLSREVTFWSLVLVAVGLNIFVWKRSR